jgi:hypothetical protein
MLKGTVSLLTESYTSTELAVHYCQNITYVLIGREQGERLQGGKPIDGGCITSKNTTIYLRLKDKREQHSTPSVAT